MTFGTFNLVFYIFQFLFCDLSHINTRHIIWILRLWRQLTAHLRHIMGLVGIIII